MLLQHFCMDTLSPLSFASRADLLFTQTFGERLILGSKTSPSLSSAIPFLPSLDHSLTKKPLPRHEWMSRSCAKASMLIAGQFPYRGQIGTGRELPCEYLGPVSPFSQHTVLPELPRNA